MKLATQEPGSVALNAWLTARSSTARISGEIAIVEVVRACRRTNETRVPDARRLLELLDLIPLTAAILERAAIVASPLLRSLDAIHLASALSIGSDLTAFVAYDRRLQAAAREENLPVVAPE